MQKEKSCALTGHRDLFDGFSKEALYDNLKSLVKEGFSVFYCGMAKGFDLTACEALLRLKKEGEKVKIIACIPCPSQTRFFSKQDKALYEKCLSLCDEQVLISKEYTPYCMHERNRYMVDRADLLVAYLKKENGGTASTVNYARKKGVDVLFV